MLNNSKEYADWQFANALYIVHDRQYNKAKRENNQMEMKRHEIVLIQINEALATFVSTDDLVQALDSNINH
jgi:hypothetical protein